MKKWIAWAVALVLLVPQCALAWNWYGHEAVAYVAWQQLTPQERAEYTQILKAHPHYASMLANHLSEKDPQRDMHVFMVAATWPDLIRDKSSPDYKDHHTTWHYFDAPLTPDGKQEPMPKADQTTAEASNAVQALKMQLFILRDRREDPAKRAKALCWVLHLVGDLHQPLHCVSLYDKDFPNGDKGGNGIRLVDPTAASNLHSLWDNLLGQQGKPSEVADAANRYVPQYMNQVSPRAKDLDPMHWVMEGRDLAKNVAYRGLELNEHGELLANVDRKRVNPTDAYVRKAQETAREQVVLGGLRLAAILK